MSLTGHSLIFMKDTLKVRLGRIIAALPAANTYLLRITGVGKKVACAGGTGSDTRTGHRASHSYSAGSIVVVLDPFDDVVDGYYEDAPYIIIAGLSYLEAVAVTDDNGDVDIDFMKQRLDLMSETSHEDNSIYSSLLKTDNTMIRDRGSNYPGELVAGSWAKSTGAGGLFYLSNFMARTGISPSCFAQFSFSDNRYSLTADQIESLTETTHEYQMRRAQQSFMLKARAANLTEAAGIFAGGAPYQLNGKSGELELVDPDMVPFSRELTLGGGYADGSWNVFSNPKINADVNKTDTDVQGMLSEEHRYDGIYSVKASRGIQLRKTNVIPVPVQQQDPRHTERTVTELDDAEETWKGLGFESEDDYNQVRHLLGLESDQYDQENVSREGFRMDKESGIWAVRAEDIEESIPPLAADAREYSIDQLAAVTADLPDGRQVKLYKNTSSFIMSEDGGFVLGDGYGGELRMNKGNLYITVPGDIYTQAGRDITTMAPRNIISKAKGRIETTSTEGPVVLKSDSHMQLISGNSGKGALVLDNRANATDMLAIREKDLTNGDPVGSGIVLQAPKSHVASYSKSMYIGGMPSNVSNDNGSVARCDVVVNGGVGAVSILGNNINAYADNTIGMGISSGTSLIKMSNSEILQVCSGTIAMAASGVLLDSVSTSVSIPKIDARGYGRSNTQRVSAGPPSIISQAGIACRGDVQVEGTLGANNVSSRDGINGQLGLQGSARNAFKLNIARSRSQTLSASVHAMMSAALGDVWRGVSEGQHTGKGPNMMSAAFPRTNSDAYHAANFMLPMAKWQKMLTSPKEWAEKPVDHAILGETMPYPGTAAYERPDVIVGVDANGSRTTDSLQNYRTNA